MKTTLLNLVALMAALLSPLMSFAFDYDFEVDGIYYGTSSNGSCTVMGSDENISGKVIIPAEVEYSGSTFSVRSINQWAFQYRTSLKSITLPAFLKYIGEEAFNGCTSLTNITLPDSITNVGFFASIGSGAFRNCTSLTSITLPNSLETIRENVFYGCSSLTSITLSNSLSSIGKQAFYGCSSLTSITLPNSISSIGKQAFRSCTSLTSITLPNSLESIEDEAFYGCQSLISIALPNSLKYIGYNAFKYCRLLTSVYIPESVSTIRDNPFSKCYDLAQINVADGNPNYSSFDGILYSKGRDVLIFCPQGKTSSVNLPYSVADISDSAFEGCDLLTSINLPNSVTSIGAQAFLGCSSLKRINIPNSVRRIASCAFEHCYRLEDIKLSDNLESIDSCLFNGCQELKSISIPGKVNVIEESAFDGCSNLEEIKYEYGETNLAVDFMFRNNSPRCNIERLYVNRELEYDIYNSANSALNNVKVVVLGPKCGSFNLRHIGADLDEILCFAIEPPSLLFCGEYRYSKTKVRVPQSSMERYKQDGVWKNFWVIEGLGASGVEPVETEQEGKCEIGRYDLNGRRVAQDFNGISIIRYSDGSTQKVLPTK